MKKSIVQIMNEYGAPKALKLLGREELAKPYMAGHAVVKVVLKEEGVIPYESRSDRSKARLSKRYDVHSEVTDIIWKNRKLEFDV